MKRASLIASLDIGANIKRLRESRGLSQEELARDICDRTTITKIENGFSKIPSFIFVVQICEKLNVTVDEFLNSSFSNSYSLNRNLIIDKLFENNIEEISSYLSNVDYDVLNIIDQSLYDFLIAKIYIDKNNPDRAKEYLLKSLNHSSTLKISNVVDLLSYNELIKNNLLIARSNSLHKIVIDRLLEIDTKSKKDINEYIYLLNDNIKECIKYGNKEDASKLLEKQISLINNHNLYKYLPIYYERKIELNKDNLSLVSEFKNKINAITKINKL